MQTLILNHYPPVIKQIKEMQQIAKAEDIEFSKLNASIREVIGNQFLSTANETGIQRFEKMLGIKPKTGQSLNDRKIYILSKLNQRKMSLSELVTILQEYANISIKTDYSEGTLMLETKSSTLNAAVVYGMMDEIIPLNVHIKVRTITQTRKAGITVKTTYGYGEKIKVKCFLARDIKVNPKQNIKTYHRNKQIITVKRLGEKHE